jgi:hypothetical protein
MELSSTTPRRLWPAHQPNAPNFAPIGCMHHGWTLHRARLELTRSLSAPLLFPRAAVARMKRIESNNGSSALSKKRSAPICATRLILLWSTPSNGCGTTHRSNSAYNRPADAR